MDDFLGAEANSKIKGRGECKKSGPQAILNNQLVNIKANQCKRLKSSRIEGISHKIGDYELQFHRKIPGKRPHDSAATPSLRLTFPSNILRFLKKFLIPQKHPPPINLQNVSAVIEMRQLGFARDRIFAHYDPVSYNDKTKVQVRSYSRFAVHVYFYINMDLFYTMICFFIRLFLSSKIVQLTKQLCNILF